MHLLFVFSMCSCTYICYPCLLSDKSLNRGEIIIYCSVLLVGIVIIMTIIISFSIFGFILFKKNQQRPVQTISNDYTSTTDTKQPTSTFHCTQDDEVNSFCRASISHTTCTLHTAGLWLYSVYDGLRQGGHCHSKSMR